MPTGDTCLDSDLNIFLTGFMGTGKTSVARHLARILGRKIVDIDEEIEKSAGMSVTEIFERLGEPRFRQLESGALKETAARKGVIVSTGGGIVLRKENIEAMRKSGLIVCLTASPESILKRTSTTDKRPLLRVPDPLSKIRELLLAREPHYRDCDLMINTEDKTPGQIARQITESLWEKTGKKPKA